MNEDLAWGLAILTWIVVVAVSMVVAISFYNNFSRNRVERITVIREVVAPPLAAPEMPTVEAEPQPFLDEAPPPRCCFRQLPLHAVGGRPEG